MITKLNKVHLFLKGAKNRFRNDYTHKVIHQLDWAEHYPIGYPNVQVKIGINSSNLVNVDEDEEACVFCKIPFNTMFIMRGICKNSYLGKKDNL